MNDKPKQPSNAEIRVAHDEDDRYRDFSCIDNDWWIKKWIECDTHRGILLERLSNFRNIYQATNAMLCELSAEGEITTRHELVGDLMDALHDYDNGVYDAKLENELYQAQVQLAEAEARHGRDRWNVDSDGSDLIVCKGEHEKGEHCREDRYVPEEKLQALQARLDAECTWEEDEDGIWTTGCEHQWVFDSGTPVENGVKYCFYCRGKMIQAALEED